MLRLAFSRAPLGAAATLVGLVVMVAASATAAIGDSARSDRHLVVSKVCRTVNVKGMIGQRAARILGARGCGTVVHQVCAPRSKVGTVISQSPPARGRVKLSVAKICSTGGGGGTGGGGTGGDGATCFGCVTVTSVTVRDFAVPGSRFASDGCSGIPPVIPAPGPVIGPNVNDPSRTFTLTWTPDWSHPNDQCLNNTYSWTVRIASGAPIAIQSVSPAPCIVTDQLPEITVTFHVPNGNVYEGPLVLDEYFGGPSC
jgi:hypothetical protein